MHTELVHIDEHEVTVAEVAPHTIAGVCECGKTAVSGTLRNVEKAIHKKHLKEKA